MFVLSLFMLGVRFCDLYDAICFNILFLVGFLVYDAPVLPPTLLNIFCSTVSNVSTFNSPCTLEKLLTIQFIVQISDVEWCEEMANSGILKRIMCNSDSRAIRARSCLPCILRYMCYVAVRFEKVFTALI